MKFRTCYEGLEESGFWKVSIKREIILKVLETEGQRLLPFFEAFGILKKNVNAKSSYKSCGIFLMSLHPIFYWGMSCLTELYLS